MTLTRSWRLVCLAQGEAPPLVPAGLARLPGAQWQARTFDAFLTEVDAGGALPDAVLAFGGEDLIRALRSHDRTCVLPVFLFAASEQAAPPGWDGSWSGDSPETLVALGDRADWSAALPALHAPLDSLRREHRFARWLAARGTCQTSDAEIFGLDAPRSTLGAWQACGWVKATKEGAAAWRAGAALRTAAAASNLTLPEPPAARPLVPAPVLSLAPAPPPQLPRSMLLAVSAFLVVLAALLWSGKVVLMRPGFHGESPAEASRRLRIGDAVAPQLRATRRPDPSQPAPSTAAGAGISVPAVATPAGEAARTVAVGQLSRESAPLFALSAGRISTLLAAPGAIVAVGAPLARLTDPRAERELERIQQEFVQVEAAIAAASRDDEDARTLAWEQSELERERLAAQQTTAEAQRAQAQEQYARTLRLAEDGVLSFREVRPDWEALQRARDAEERVRGQLEAFLAARALPSAAGRGEPPSWLGARRARLEDELQTARSLAAPRLVRAAAAGELLEWRVAVGSEVEEGAELARLAAGDAWAEVALDRADAVTRALQLGEVEVRLAAGSPWAAASEFEVIPAAAGGSRLRARLPAALQAAARAGSSVELRFRFLE